MGEASKITSVVQLARHNVGAVLYRVILRPVGQANIKIPPNSDWMANCHPKVLFDRGLITNKVWRFTGKPPKLCGTDFYYVTELLTSDMVVERFIVVDISRSSDTGEFYYCDESGDWMPEEYLMTTATMARREKCRLKGLFRQWCERNAVDEA